MVKSLRRRLNCIWFGANPGRKPGQPPSLRRSPRPRDQLLSGKCRPSKQKVGARASSGRTSGASLKELAAARIAWISHGLGPPVGYAAKNWLASVLPETAPPSFEFNGDPIKICLQFI